MSNFAFVKRERCGCVSAIIVEDEALHYVSTVAAWKRNPRVQIEKVTVEQGKDELAQTFRYHPVGRRRRKTWEKCGRG